MKLPTAEQLDAFRRLGAATVHEAQGRTGALDSAITPLDPTSLLAGTALTVDCRPGDNLAIQHAVTIAQPGDVLVVDAKGYAEGGAWGDLLTLAAQRAGIAGLVIDGSARDSRSIIDMGFPVFSRVSASKVPTRISPARSVAPSYAAVSRFAPAISSWETPTESSPYRRNLFSRHSNSPRSALPPRRGRVTPSSMAAPSWMCWV